MKLLDYIKGNRRGKEAHDLEKSAMNDPFLADAIEGYDSVNGDHIRNIENLHNKISKKTQNHNNIFIWKIAVAAIIFITAFSGYFSLMNHQSSMMTANNQTTDSYLNIYIPDKYVQMKRLELTENKEKGISEISTINPVIDIANLNEIITPVERLNLYVPKTYAKLKDSQSENQNNRPSDKSRLRAEIISSDKIADPENNDSYNINKRSDVMGIMASTPSAKDFDKEEPILANQIMSTSTQRLKKANGNNLNNVPIPLIGYPAYLEYLKKALVESVDSIFTQGSEKMLLIELYTNTEGYPENIKIVKGLSPTVDNKAIKLIESGSLWQYKNGKAIIKIEF